MQGLYTDLCDAAHMCYHKPRVFVSRYLTFTLMVFSVHYIDISGLLRFISSQTYSLFRIAMGNYFSFDQ